jgi:hypothetical protein
VAKSGDVTQESTVPLSSDTLVGDGISPQGYLPDLHHGQTWTTCTYSLFHPAAQPLELIEARVEHHEPIIWNGSGVKTWVVVYRAIGGAEMNAEPCAKVWVLDDGPTNNGMVIQQELFLFGSKVRFTRLTADRDRALRDAIEPFAKEEIPAEESEKLLKLITSRPRSNG